MLRSLRWKTLQPNLDSICQIRIDRVLKFISAIVQFVVYNRKKALKGLLHSECDGMVWKAQVAIARALWHLRVNQSFISRTC